MENVTILDHPLIQHKISLLRDKSTGTNEFRSLIEEIAMLMGYEALRDLPLKEVQVETPIETCMTPMVAGKKLLHQRWATLDYIGMKRLMSLTNITANCQTPSTRGPLWSQILCWLQAAPLWLPLILSNSTAEKPSSSCASSLRQKD